VHPRKREFIEAFEAGDPEKMAKALKSIAEEFGGVTLSAVTNKTSSGRAERLSR